MSDIGDPLLLLLLLLSMLLLLLLPSSPGARPGDTVRRRSPIVTCGADQRSIARSLPRRCPCSSLAYQNRPPAAAAAPLTTTRFVPGARPHGISRAFRCFAGALHRGSKRHRGSAAASTATAAGKCKSVFYFSGGPTNGGGDGLMER